MKISFACLMMVWWAVACNDADTNTKAIQTDTVQLAQQQPERPKNIEDEFRPAGDSVILPAFEITVQLSQTAEQKLRNANETIIVSAMLSGIPKDTTLKEYREWGEFPLGNVDIEIPAPGTARFDNAKILKSDFEKLSSKDIQVLINVFSGRKSTGDNLLDCDILQEPISKVRQQENVLKGKLIYE